MGLLRLFLALSVVIWHLPDRSLNLLDAGVAVLFFFILSGFYMALILNERYTPASEKASEKDFYLSRFFRLAPVYYGFLLFEIVWFHFQGFPTVFYGHIPAGVAALNLLVVGQDYYQAIVNSINYGQINPLVAATVAHAPIGFFQNDWMLIGQAWSLGSEILFYALAPLIVRSIPRILAAIAISLTIRWGLVFGAGFHSEVWSYDFFPSTLCMFLLGSMAYHLYKHVRERTLTVPIGYALTGAAAVYGILAWHADGGILLINRATGFDSVRMWVAFVAVAAAIPFLFAAWKSNRFDRWIGELSYPLYITHGFIIGTVFARINGPSHGGKEIISVIISLAVSAAIYIYVDKPVDLWRHRLFGRKGYKPTADDQVRRVAL